jgi:hypothetical protein
MYFKINPIVLLFHIHEATMNEDVPVGLDILLVVSAIAVIPRVLVFDEDLLSIASLLTSLCKHQEHLVT